jgi:hypothetical protein
VCASLGLTSAECLLQEETIEAAFWFGSGSKLQQQQEGLGPWWNNIKNGQADFESETFLIDFLRILPHSFNHNKDQNQRPQQQPAWTFHRGLHLVVKLLTTLLTLMLPVSRSRGARGGDHPEEDIGGSCAGSSLPTGRHQCHRPGKRSKHLITFSSIDIWSRFTGSCTYLNLVELTQASKICPFLCEPRAPH